MISCLHPQLQSNSLSQPRKHPLVTRPYSCLVPLVLVNEHNKAKAPWTAVLSFSSPHPGSSDLLLLSYGLDRPACSLSSGQRGRLSLRTGRGSVLRAGGLKGSVSLALKEGRRPLLLPTRSLSGPISGQGNGRSHHPQQSLTC